MTSRVCTPTTNSKHLSVAVFILTQAFLAWDYGLHTRILREHLQVHSPEPFSFLYWASVEARIIPCFVLHPIAQARLHRIGIQPNSGHMSDSSCRQTPSAGDDPSLNCLSMDFNSDVVQRSVRHHYLNGRLVQQLISDCGSADQLVFDIYSGQWPSSTSAAAMSAVAVQHPRLVGSEDQMPLTDLGSSLSSADQSPPMEAYHATQWPIQLQQPPLGRASYGGAAPYRNPMRPVSYSSDYPNPAMWNTYDVRLPQNYVLSNQPNERPNREGHRVPHTDPGELLLQL